MRQVLGEAQAKDAGIDAADFAVVLVSETLDAIDQVVSPPPDREVS